MLTRHVKSIADIPGFVKLSTGLFTSYPQKNLTDINIIGNRWRKVEESGGWSTF